MKNIIILTSGLSGSSVVAHLLSKAGYWLGDSTCVKTDYNTYENSELVALNHRLLKAVDYEKYSVYVDTEKCAEVEALFYSIDLMPFKQFISDCQRQGKPWLWKDPRLWVTLGFWMHLLDKESLKIVVVDRSLSQRWISEILRRNIQTIVYCKHYNESINNVIMTFIKKYKLPYITILFDDLIRTPESVLSEINFFLKCDILLSDLKLIYHNKLYKRIRGFKDFVLAFLIYIKNYKRKLS